MKNQFRSYKNGQYLRDVALKQFYEINSENVNT